MEYVPSLYKRSQWHADSNRHLRTGDLVWIVDPSSPGGFYPLGRLIALHYGIIKSLAPQPLRAYQANK